MKKQKQLHSHCTERISLLWLSVFISESFSWDAQKLTLENNKLAKPSPWKVGTARIRVINVLPKQVNTPLIPSPGCGWLSSLLDLASKMSKAFWLRTDELDLQYGHIFTEDGKPLRLLQHQGFQIISPPEHGTVNAIQKMSFFTHADVYIYIIEKSTSFFIILFAEIAEHFGLSLLDRKYPEIESQDGAFQPEIPTPPSYSLSAEVSGSPDISAASPTWCTQTLPLLSRFKSSWHDFLPAFSGAPIAKGPDAGAWWESSKARGGAHLLQRHLLRFHPCGWKGE